MSLQNPGRHAVNRIAFSSDGRNLVSGDSAGHVHLYSIEDRETSAPGCPLQPGGGRMQPGPADLQRLHERVAAWEPIQLDKGDKFGKFGVGSTPFGRY